MLAHKEQGLPAKLDQSPENFELDTSGFPDFWTLYRTFCIRVYIPVWSVPENLVGLGASVIDRAAENSMRLWWRAACAGFS